MSNREDTAIEEALRRGAPEGRDATRALAASERTAASLEARIERSNVAAT